jgi:hypothetical protein
MESKIMKNIEYEKECLKRQAKITKDRITSIREHIARLATSGSVGELEDEVKNLRMNYCEYHDIKKRIFLLSDLLSEDDIENVI